MIGRIAGIILHRARDHVLIDVRGIGYIVHLSERTAAGLPPAGQAVALYTELVVREDLLQLFGFPTLLEKEWHKLLTSVQGVGAKVALAVLGTMGAEGLGHAIALGDWSAVRKAPGVGPKLAQRVVLELKDKAPQVMALGGALTVDMGVRLPRPSRPGQPPPRRRPRWPAPRRARHRTHCLRHARPRMRFRPWAIWAMASPRRSPPSPKRRRGNRRQMCRR